VTAAATRVKVVEIFTAVNPVAYPAHTLTSSPSEGITTSIELVSLRLLVHAPLTMAPLSISITTLEFLLVLAVKVSPAVYSSPVVSGVFER
jgi:hypothetical protein